MNESNFFEIFEVIDFEYEYIVPQSAYIHFKDHNGCVSVKSAKGCIWHKILKILESDKPSIFYFVTWKNKIVGVLNEDQITNVLIDRGAE